MNTITSDAFGDAKVTEYTDKMLLLRVGNQVPVGTTVKVRLAGAVLDRRRHVCAFFNSDEEEYRVLLPFIKDCFWSKASLRLVQHLAAQERRASTGPGTRHSGNPLNRDYKSLGFALVSLRHDPHYP